MLSKNCNYFFGYCFLTVLFFDVFIVFLSLWCATQSSWHLVNIRQEHKVSSHLISHLVSKLRFRRTWSWLKRFPVDFAMITIKLMTFTFMYKNKSNVSKTVRNNNNKAKSLLSGTFVQIRKACVQTQSEIIK